MRAMATMGNSGRSAHQEALDASRVVPAEPVLRLSMFRIPLPFPAGGYPHPATGCPPRRNSSGAGVASGAEGNFHQILYEKTVSFSNCDTIRWNETAPCGQKAPVRKNSAEKASLRGQKGGSCCDLSG